MAESEWERLVAERNRLHKERTSPEYVARMLESDRQMMFENQQRITPGDQLASLRAAGTLGPGVQGVESADAVVIDAAAQERVRVELVPEVATGAEHDGVGEIPSGAIADAAKDVTTLRTLPASANETGVAVPLADDFRKERIQITDETLAARGFGFLAHFRRLQSERQDGKA